MGYGYAWQLSEPSDRKAGHHGGGADLGFGGYSYSCCRHGWIAGDRLKFGSPLASQLSLSFISDHFFMITFELDSTKLRLVEKVFLFTTYLTLHRSHWLSLTSEHYKACFRKQG